jgi:S1-C subfamily serine protease
VRRFAALGIGLALTLAAAALLLAPKVTAQQGAVLSGKDIAEMYKPGVVQVETIWTANATVNQWALPAASVQALEDVATREAKAGTIGGDANAIFAAMILELSKNPLQYLVPTGQNDPDVKNPLGVKSQGSGFIITPDGYIVTNEHVVAETGEVTDLFVNTLLTQLLNADVSRMQASMNKGNLTFTDEEQKEYKLAMAAYYTKYATLDVQPRSVSVQIGIAIPGLPTIAKGVPADVRKDGEVTPGKDVAVLKIEQPNQPTVPVGDDTKLEVGDKVYVIGFPAAADEAGTSNPAGVEPTFTSGDISARKTMAGGWQALQTDADITQGNSGGPAFNEQGQVIGIATFGIPTSTAAGINFLVPMSIADQYLNELNIKPQESELSKQYIQALSDFHAGKCSTALKEFEQIKELNPGFPDVQNYIDQTAGDNAACKPVTTFPMMYVIIGGVAVILVIIVAVFALTKKKPAPAMAGAGAASMQMPMGAGAPPPMMAGAPPAGMPGGAMQGGPPMGALPPRSYGSLQCTAGSAAGRRFEITKAGLLIGRDSAKCQVVLTDDAVSKEHAWIVPVDDGVMVIDRGSTNGVFVNSVDAPKVSKVKLQHGDKIYIGKGSAVFTYLSS